MNFSKEEIALCKEIAKYYRLPNSLWVCKESEDNVIFDYAGDFQYFPPYIPLWTWQDARDWLRERNWFLVLRNFGNVSHFGIWKEEQREPKSYKYAQAGKTDLEAILKVVLEILREGK